MNFNFLVDKNVAYTYWLQMMTDWSWYSEEKNKEYYLSLIGGLSKKEKEELKSLKQILQKEGNGYIWLWRRYTKKKFKKTSEKKKWQDIKNTLKDKFEKVWQKENHLLKDWKDVLEDFNFERFKNEINKTSHFLDGEAPRQKVKIPLLLSENPEHPTGHAKREFENIILIKLSNLKVNQLNIARTVGLLLHEYIHKIEHNSSDFEPLLKESFEKIIVPAALDISEGYTWKHVMKESVLRSISSNRLNTYIGRKLSQDLKVNPNIDEIDNLNFSKRKKEKEYGFIIRSVSSSIEPLTKFYLNNDKKVNKEYTDKVASKWVELFQSGDINKVKT